MVDTINPSVTEPAGGEFLIRRDFDAPRELVFKAWTETERLDAVLVGAEGLHDAFLQARSPAGRRLSLRHEVA